MSEPSLDDLLNLGERQIMLIMLGLRQDLIPSWIFFNQRKEAFVMATPWKDDSEKEAAAQYLRREMRKRDAIAYSFICEGWQAIAPEDWDPQSGQRAREMPERQEIAIAVAANKQQTKQRRWLIKRDWHDQVVGLESIAEPWGEPSGWALELLRD
jgi:hypothetical protein